MKANAVLNKAMALLAPYLKRSDITELVVNRPGEVGLELNNGIWEFKKDKSFTLQNIERLGAALAADANQVFNAHTPIFAGRLPEYGHRIQLCVGSMVESGVALAVRVSNGQDYPIEAFMPENEADSLKSMIREGKTILICAGTGTGKTTLMNAMVKHIPIDERIITLEDTRELKIPHHNTVNFTNSKTGTDIASLAFKDYINSMMRLRPSRILLGEIDTENTLAFLNLANSGHSGSISTIHASSPAEAINRMSGNAQMAGARADKRDIEAYVNEAIDVFVMITKTFENGKKICRATYEVAK